jgi:hypothetical protein
MNKPELFNESNEATYCPEDNCIRLYVGRVPKPEYLALKAEGWRSTPKQTCDFVATWSTSREDTAISYAGVIGDEDIPPAERAADRAERFAGYLGKRMDEAGELADKYESGPSVHGYQNAAKAERSAARHDRQADRAVNQWSKAEYWERRTAGVISHCLYKDLPGVRMGRIKILESELRKSEATNAKYAEEYESWRIVSQMTDAKAQDEIAFRMACSINDWTDYIHPRTGKTCKMYDLMREDAEDRLTGAEAAAVFLARHHDPKEESFNETSCSRWVSHYKLRLAYENQMLEAQGGRAAHLEMEPGGWLGKYQIQKVNKSPATGRVTSVQVWGTTRGFTKESGYTIEETRPCLVNVNTERMGKEVYRPPTDEERAAFSDAKKQAKEKRGVISTINPTDEDAERLQSMLNERAAFYDKGKNYPRKMGTVERITQDKYSNHWTDGKALREVGGAKVRFITHGWQWVESVVILTDKPQKPLPPAVWEKQKVTA